MASEPTQGSTEGGDRAGRLRITDRAIVLPATCGDVVDVLFDGVRVFSIAADAGRVQAGGRRRVTWPPVLHGFLRGSSTVTLRAHVSGEVLASQDVVFSDAPERVRVVDEAGVPVALDKWGALKRTFADDSSGRTRLLAAARELLAELNDVVGVPAFLVYGTLLGAVRSGRLIGHDVDVDVAYYSRFQHPADIMRESFALERRLKELGWETSRKTGAFFRVRRAGEGEEAPPLDLFASYHCNGWFALHKWVRGHLPDGAPLPLGEVQLEGMSFPAPHEPEALLALTYGESWRVPDPSFSFDYRGGIRDRAEGWFGYWRRGKGRWRAQIAQHLERERPPSPFARYVDERLSDGTTVVDVGCGVGNDAVWMSRGGRRVIGLDYMPNALAHARTHAERHGSSARFEELNLYELRSVLVHGARLALAEPDVAVYARSMLNVLWPEGRTNLWLLGKTLLGGGGLLFLEFLTHLGPDGSPQQVTPPLLGGLDPDLVVAEVAARGGRVVTRDELDLGGERVCRLAVAFAR